MGDKVIITRRMYGWSKYGGARHGLVKEELEEWFCQVCAERQVKVLPNYMFDYFGDKRDFIRICSKCKSKAKRGKIKSIISLFKKLRRIYIEDLW